MIGKLSAGSPVQLLEVNHEETSVDCSRGRGFDGRGDHAF